TSSDYTFYINQTEAEILSASDSTVTVKIPEKASSGAASVTLDGQAYYGPVFTVEGIVSIATSFNDFKGAIHQISQIIEYTVAGYYIIVGSFTYYSGLHAGSASSDDERTYIDHIADISKTCDFREGSFQAGKGSNGSLNTIARSTVDGDLFVGS